MDVRRLTEGPEGPGRPLSPGKPRGPWNKQRGRCEKIHIDLKNFTWIPSRITHHDSSNTALSMNTGLSLRSETDTINRETTLHTRLTSVKSVIMISAYMREMENLTLGPAGPESPLAPSRPEKPCERRQATKHCITTNTNIYIYYISFQAVLHTK